jgi:hypothetical protein
MLSVAANGFVCAKPKHVEDRFVSNNKAWVFAIRRFNIALLLTGCRFC